MLEIHGLYRVLRYILVYNKLGYSYIRVFYRNVVVILVFLENITTNKEGHFVVVTKARVSPVSVCHVGLKCKL